MRHRKKKGRLSRNTAWRKATLKSLANDLFKHQRIETTMAKARALRSFAEPLITLAKKSPGSIIAMRRAFQKLSDKDTVKNLFTNLAPLYKDVNGGYTRIMAFGDRRGDGARMAIMELTKRTISDEELLGIDTKEKEKKRKPKAQKGKKEEREKTKTVHPAAKTEEKDKHSAIDVKKEKAKTEREKVTKRGFFKRFQRKSIG
ncbi:MAG: 50S ribosomal protein L17 [Candidatus Omnitrophota bacterium]